MEFKQIQELLKAVNKSNLSELTIKDGDFEISIKQNTGEPQYVAMPSAPQVIAQQPVAPQPQPAASEAPPAATASGDAPSNAITIKSPMIGTFYRSSAPDKPPFVSVGDDVQPGKVVCIIE